MINGIDIILVFLISKIIDISSIRDSKFDYFFFRIFILFRIVNLIFSKFKFSRKFQSIWKK